MRQATILAATLVIAGVTAASAQQLGREPYSNTRSASLAAQFQHSQRMQKLQNKGNEGLIQQFINTYNSSSTSIGNLSEITQILGDGAEGVIATEGGQLSEGSQTSGAKTKTTISDSTQTQQAEALVEALTTMSGPQ